MEEINVLEILGKNMHDIRFKKNISIEELAQKTNINIESLKKIETGEYSGVKIYQYIEIANALGVDYEEIIKRIEFTQD